MKKSFLLSLIILSINSYGIEVKIENNTMVVNGELFYMKGICYHPVKIGKTKRSFDNLDDDIILMKEAGINTIRVYEPIDDINVLDKIGRAHV